MKKIIILALIILGIFNTCYAQSIVENKTDEFTKATVKISSWEKLFMKFEGNSTCYFRITEVNHIQYFELKYMTSKLKSNVYSVQENSELMFKMNNDSIITLNAIKYSISEKGGGAINMAGSSAWGIHIRYSIDKKDVENFKYGFSKIRLYTTDGYIEEDNIKMDNSLKLYNTLKLF